MNYPYPFSIFNQFAGPILLIVLVDVILKGMALWKAGRNNQSYWFVALLVFNTAGILPLIYILFFQKPKNS